MSVGGHDLDAAAGTNTVPPDPIMTTKSADSATSADRDPESSEGTQSGSVTPIDTRAALLAVLSDDAATGLMLTERLAERSKDAWRPSAVAVYPVLSQLVDEGMATVEIRDGRPMYTATEAGHTEARRLVIERGRTPWPTPVEVQSRQLMRAVGAFTLATRQFAASGTAAQIASAIDIVHDAQRRLFGVLAGEESPDR